MSKEKSKLEILPEAKLKAISTQRLKNMKRISHAIAFSIEQAAYCECCGDFQGEDWEKEIGKFSQPYWKYKELIKSILSTREHLKTTKRLPNLSSVTVFKYNFSEKRTVLTKRRCTLCDKSKHCCKGHFPNEFKVDGKDKRKTSIEYRQWN